MINKLDIRKSPNLQDTTASDDLDVAEPAVLPEDVQIVKHVLGMGSAQVDLVSAIGSAQVDLVPRAVVRLPVRREHELVLDLGLEATHRLALHRRHPGGENQYPLSNATL